ncbi:MAG: hypothetical protein G5Z42_00800 [Caldisphaeraceae archaeon]|nr:hypothetical protein [Caldisphaeraceae archaeon]MEB3691894.1 hypothetical protein [Caldisphaeraceae archaeon]MEB3797342.1 hypothetical protein [Caldisphaeraceae archaeon]
MIVARKRGDEAYPSTSDSYYIVIRAGGGIKPLPPAIIIVMIEKSLPSE